MNHLDLFSGIGGFAIAAENVWHAEHRVVAFCESDPFCQAVLKKHWPCTPIVGDITTYHPRCLGPIGLLTGGFPCQPFSRVGQKRGTKDDRFLWPAMLRIIRHTHPTWIIAENVTGLINIANGLVFERVLADLEDQNYDVQPFVIPALAVNAPHRRDRVWIVAHARGLTTSGGITAENAKRERRRGGRHGNTHRSERQTETARPNSSRDRWEEKWIAAATRLCALDDGLSRGLVRPRGWRHAALKAAGNAIVPQVAQVIMTAIKTTETANVRT